MKNDLKIILSEKYKSYENAHHILEFEKLVERRGSLCLQFAIKIEKIKNIFTANHKIHSLQTRFEEENEINHAKTGRMMNYPIIYMQRLLHIK